MMLSESFYKGEAFINSQEAALIKFKRKYGKNFSRRLVKESLNLGAKEGKLCDYGEEPEQFLIFPFRYGIEMNLRYEPKISIDFFSRKNESSFTSINPKYVGESSFMRGCAIRVLRNLYRELKITKDTNHDFVETKLDSWL